MHIAWYVAALQARQQGRAARRPPLCVKFPVLLNARVAFIAVAGGGSTARPATQPGAPHIAPHLLVSHCWRQNKKNIKKPEMKMLKNEVGWCSG